MTATAPRAPDANAYQGDFGETWLRVVAAGGELLHGPSTTLDLDKADVELTWQGSHGGTYSPQVKVHLSVLLALIALTRAWGYWLERYSLTTSTRGAVHGATATDVKAQLPALHLLIVISIAAVVLFLVNIRLRGFALPVIAVGLSYGTS